MVQGLADRAAGQLAVLGVDVGDTRAAGGSFAAAAGVSMPTLFDEESLMLRATGRSTLPFTVFVDGGGRAYLHALPITDEQMDALVRTHTGVTVRR